MLPWFSLSQVDFCTMYLYISFLHCATPFFFKLYCTSCVLHMVTNCFLHFTAHSSICCTLFLSCCYALFLSFFAALCFTMLHTVNFTLLCSLSFILALSFSDVQHLLLLNLSLYDAIFFSLSIFHFATHGFSFFAFLLISLILVYFIFSFSITIILLLEYIRPLLIFPFCVANHELIAKHKKMISYGIKQGCIPNSIGSSGEYLNFMSKSWFFSAPEIDGTIFLPAICIYLATHLNCLLEFIIYIGYYLAFFVDIYNICNNVYKLIYFKASYSPFVLFSAHYRLSSTSVIFRQCLYRLLL